MEIHQIESGCWCRRIHLLLNKICIKMARLCCLIGISNGSFSINAECMGFLGSGDLAPWSRKAAFEVEHFGLGLGVVWRCLTQLLSETFSKEHSFLCVVRCCTLAFCFFRLAKSFVLLFLFVCEKLQWSSLTSPLEFEVIVVVSL